VDLTIDLFEATVNKDFGDLPAAYNLTDISDDGARHVVGNLRLGTIIDLEANGFETSLPYGSGDDDNNLNDEDGVETSDLTKWSMANGGNITVTVTGCTGTCYLNGWIDWNGDSSFSQAGDRVFTNTVVSNGATLLSLSVPTNAFWSQSIYARFRLCGGTGGSNDCSALTGQSATGEVEDYLWGFGPNAVTVQRLDVKTETTNNTAALILAASVVAALGLAGVVMARRRRTA
jgi:hypothetical protein